MTIREEITEIIYLALYFQGTDLSQEVLDSKRRIAEKAADKILNLSIPPLLCQSIPKSTHLMNGELYQKLKREAVQEGEQ